MPPRKPTTKTTIFESLFRDIDQFLAESVRQDDLVAVVKTVTEALRTLEGKMAKALDETKNLSARDLAKLRSDVDALGKKLTALVAEARETGVASMKAEVTALQTELSRIEDLIPEIPDHTDRFLALEEGLKNTQNLNGEDIRNFLEALPEGDKLAMEAIAGLLDALEAIKKAPAGTGGTRGLHFLIDGVKKGLISNMNFKAGSNMAIAYSKVNGQDTITFTSTGGGPGGLTVETPAETPDGSRTQFTVSAEPSWVVADGTTYFDGAGYTYAALTITMDVPPSASVRVII